MRQSGVRRALIALAAAVPLLCSAAAAQPRARIGFVDFQRILARSSAGVAAREQIERERAAMQKQMDKKSREIGKLQEGLIRKGPLLSAEVRKEKQDALERKVRDFRRMRNDYQKELEKKDQELLQKVLAGVTGVVERFGKEHGYLIIVEKRSGGVVFGAAEADITDEIIKAYDEERSRTKQ
ncbi:MAG: OmpH family outer membrane protein [Candidatus Methylomirabilia bacterium]